MSDPINKYGIINPETGKAPTCNKLPSTSTVAERQAEHKRRMLIRKEMRNQEYGQRTS